MDVTRRGFLKLSGTVLGKRCRHKLKARVCICHAVEGPVCQRNHNDLPLLFGGMQYHCLRAER